MENNPVDKKKQAEELLLYCKRPTQSLLWNASAFRVLTYMKKQNSKEKKNGKMNEPKP